VNKHRQTKGTVAATREVRIWRTTYNAFSMWMSLVSNTQLRTDLSLMKGLC
jgi:hypothetical protein